MVPCSPPFARWEEPMTVEIWRGPSRIDGSDIVVLATGYGPVGSANTKTGPMIQTYILRADVDPFRAVESGGDFSICGGCQHRRDPVTGDRTCYVSLFRGPGGAWKAWKTGPYSPERMSPRKLGELARHRNRSIRIGAYGDPGAVPIHIWKAMIRSAPGFTCYTHQWQRLGSAWAKFAMASVESEAERDRAHRKGFRTYRIADKPGPGELECPHPEKGILCFQCGLCSGSTGAKSITIPPHGNGERKLRDRMGL
jgi:hypothetical protein